MACSETNFKSAVVLWREVTQRKDDGNKLKQVYRVLTELTLINLMS